MPRRRRTPKGTIVLSEGLTEWLPPGLANLTGIALRKYGVNKVVIHDLDPHLGIRIHWQITKTSQN